MASATPPVHFTATQWRIISSALVLLAIAATLAAVIVAVALLGRFVGYFSSVLFPLAVAGVLALILRPLVAVIEARLRLQRTAAVVLLYGAFVLLVGAVLALALPPLVAQVLDFISYAPTLWAGARSFVAQHYPQWHDLLQRLLANPTVHQIADAAVAQLKTALTQALPSLRAAGSSLAGLVSFSIQLAIIPVYLFFFLLARGDPVEKLHPNLPFLPSGVRDDVVYLVREFAGIVASFFRGQLVIGLIMGVLLAAGYSVVGLRFGLVLGLVVGVLNIVPYLGTIVALLVGLPLAYLQPAGGWQLVGLVVVVNVVVQACEGLVLTPRIMGAQTGLHPVAITVAIFFWGTALGGILGMLLAVPLTAFFVTAWRLAKQKYFHASD